MHTHFCRQCGIELETGDFDCEYDTDHDFALCTDCANDDDDDADNSI